MRDRARGGCELEEAFGIQISGVTWGTRDEDEDGGQRDGDRGRRGSKESEQPTTSLAASDLYLTFS